MHSRILLLSMKMTSVGWAGGVMGHLPAVIIALSFIAGMALWHRKSILRQSRDILRAA